MLPDVHNTDLCAAPNLTYAQAGGTTPQVISNVEVVQVNWGASVDPKVTSFFEQWYPAIVSSEYLWWLNEYDTVGQTGGTNQRIGAGTYKKNPASPGSWTITPTNTAKTLDQDAIGAEIVAQIAAGNLPKPTKDATGQSNTIYMIDFPPGMVQEMVFPGQPTQASCKQFCGFHYTATDATGTKVYFGVHPDTGAGSGCEPQTDAAGKLSWVCGGTFDQLTAAASTHGHELVEAITDPDSNGAWVDTNCKLEIGDICANTAGPCGDGTCDSPAVGQVTVAGKQYPVQTEWSNKQNDCVVHGKTCAVNSDCSGTTPICDTTLKVCRACGASDCSGATPVCETAGELVGQCVQCNKANGAACTAPAGFCDTTTDKCRACVSSDCSAPKAICEMTGAKQGSCVQCDPANKTACSGATPICDPTSFTCVACATSMDCSGATPICDSMTKTCRACSGNNDCTGGKVCDTGTGANAGQCVGCQKNSDCVNPTPTCSMTTNTCGACKADADCASGQTCDTGTGSCTGGTSGNPSNPGTTTTTTSCSVSSVGSASGSGFGLAGILLGLGLAARKRARK